MKRSALFASFFLILASVRSPALAREKAWWEPEVEYNFDIASAYLSRAKVSEDRPIQMNELAVDWDVARFVGGLAKTDLPDLGRLGFWYWNYSSLSGRCQDKHRRFVPEQDWAITYDYDWKFSDRWSLDTELMAEWQTFHGEKPSDSPFSFEWRIKQQLKNPYVTPYYKGRFTMRPLVYNYWQIGLKKKITDKTTGCGWLPEKLSITPNVACDLCDRAGVRKRFGARPAGESDYSAGFLSVIGELTVEYRFTDWFAVHATVGQFGIVNRKGRDNISSPNHADLTYWQTGFTLFF